MQQIALYEVHFSKQLILDFLMPSKFPGIRSMIKCLACNLNGHLFDTFPALFGMFSSTLHLNFCVYLKIIA